MRLFWEALYFNNLGILLPGPGHHSQSEGSAAGDDHDVVELGAQQVDVIGAQRTISFIYGVNRYRGLTSSATVM